MSFQDNLNDLRAKLAEVPELSDLQREVLTSDALLARIMPMMTAFVAENVTKTQEVKDKTGEKLRDLVGLVMEGKDVNVNIDKFSDELSKGLLDTTLLSDAHDIAKDHWLIGPLMAGAMTIGHMATLLYSYMGVSAEKTRQIAAEDIRPYLLDLDTLIKELFRHPNNYAYVQDQMQKMGISDDKIGVYLDNARTFLPLDLLKLLWHREEIGNPELEKRLNALLIPNEDHELVKTGLFNYPGVQDL